MSPVSRYLTGLRLLPSGFALIFQPGVKRYVLIPFLINLILFGTALWYGYTTLGNWVNILTGWLPSWLDWLASLIWSMVAIAVVIFIYYTFTLLANLMAAPFNSLLAERVEANLRGIPAESGGGIATLPSIAARTVWSEIRKLLYQLKWLIFLVILSVIPGVNLIAPFAWFYFGAWMMAVNYVDYPMGNHDQYFRHVKAALKTDRMTALGLGTGIFLMTLVPVLNFLAMPVGVATGTLYYVRRQGDLSSALSSADNA